MKNIFEYYKKRVNKPMANISENEFLVTWEIYM